MNYTEAFLLAALLSAVFTPVSQKLAVKFGAVDWPDKERKFHRGGIPRWGGLAIFAGFIITLALAHPHYSRSLVGLLIGLLVVLVVGLIDDAHGLSPRARLIWQFIAAVVVLSGGIGIVGLTNPFGGLISLSIGRFTVHLGPILFHIMPLANALSLMWMVGMVNTVNFMDGLDGLAAGISAIAALVMFLLAASPHVNQPAVALLAIILTGACVGFLPFNSYPAKVFLGDGGAYFLGLSLSLLAIYSGAKLATAVLVLGFTIIDSTWVVLRRLHSGRSPFKADRQHFHHRLLEIGLSQRQAVWLLYAMAAIMGGLALVSGTVVKVVSLVLLVVIASLVITAVTRRTTRL